MKKQLLTLCLTISSGFSVIAQTVLPGRSAETQRFPVLAGESFSVNVTVENPPNKFLKTGIGAAAISGALTPVATSRSAEQGGRRLPVIGAGATLIPGLMGFGGKAKTSVRISSYDKFGNLQSTNLLPGKGGKRAEYASKLDVTKDGYVDVSVENTGRKSVLISGFQASNDKTVQPFIRPKDQMEFSGWIPSDSEPETSTDLNEVVVKAPYLYNDLEKYDTYILYQPGSEGYDGSSAPPPGGSGSGQTSDPAQQKPQVTPKSNYCATYALMWSLQQEKGVETFAWMTNKGYVVLPICGTNQRTKANECNTEGRANVEYFPTRATGMGGYEVWYNGEWLQIVGALHTHPYGPKWATGPSEQDRNFVKYWHVPLFGIENGGMFMINETTYYNSAKQVSTWNPGVKCWGAVDPYSNL